MTNVEIAERFERLAQLMDIHSENSFKTKTYSSAAFRIEKTGAPLNEMLPEQIRSIPGIGDAVTQKIIELLNSGKMEALEAYEANTPAGVKDMLSLKGLGPKKIALLWKELGIESIGELEYACNENRLTTLKGFGTKTQESILKSIAFQKDNEGYYLWAEAEALSKEFELLWSTEFPGAKMGWAGDFRRDMPVVNAIDVVVDVPMGPLTAWAMTTGHPFQAEEDNSLIMKGPGGIRFVIHSRPGNDWTAQRFLMSCSAPFSEAFRATYSIPESVATENEIFEANGLRYVPPYLREQASMLEKAKEGTVPQTLETDAIKGIIHSHSTWSDGRHTLEQMAMAAIERGYEYLVISDHSQTAVYAGGLRPEQIRLQHAEIDALNSKLAPFRIFKGIESDILGDGGLDYAPEVLDSFEVVIASVHSQLKMDQEKAMDRLLNAIRNPYTTILGHPTGRLLLSRPGYPLDHKAIIDACIENGVVIELNAHPRRLDMDWTWIPYALESGALLSVNPDAHSMEGIDLVRYGVLAGRKGGLTAKANLSSMDLETFSRFVEENKKKRSGL